MYDGELPDTSTAIAVAGGAASLAFGPVLFIVFVSVVAMVVALRYLDRRDRASE